jgi:hypothetical protein
MLTATLMTAVVHLTAIVGDHLTATSLIVAGAVCFVCVLVATAAHLSPSIQPIMDVDALCIDDE